MTNYIALARKWRPRRFSELVGQEHVIRALTHALDSDRVHHAFLFTGTRGVGKTTIARILAKCLNCDAGVSANPCGECGTCREIEAGRFVDLIEVDAASRTKVDDTRELLDNVQYAPTRGRYKVYLIDEVHMLSTHSFNALLKTLEEPPPRVKFLLATTDPQKLPITVLSRCLQFNLKRLSVTQIADRLRFILEAEGIEFEPAGVRLIAQAADGSARDGLSLLDQLLAFGGGKVSEADARAMLGTVARDHVVRFAELLAGLDPVEIVRYARSLEEWGPDYAQILDELASLLTRVALKQVVADFDGDDLYAPELLERLAKAISPEDVQLFYQIAITGRRDLHLAPDPKTGFEMTLLRMIAFRPAGTAGQPTTAPAPAPAARTVEQPPPARSAPVSSAQAAMSPPPAAPSTPPIAGSAESWTTIVGQLELSGIARQLANHCAWVGRNGSVIKLAIDPRNKLMRTRVQEEKLAQALSRYFGEPIKLEFVEGELPAETPAQAEQRASMQEIEAARAALDNDPTVRAFKERFGATLLPETVRPVK